VLGPLRSSIASDTGLSSVPVIAPGTHDTASAVVAVPARGDSWAYISSGTWSLMGAEIAGPLVNDAVGRYNFTNAGGAGGTIRLLKNVLGLWLRAGGGTIRLLKKVMGRWLVQDCRRALERSGQALTYEQLVQLADAAPPFVSLVDPDDASFWLPPSMPRALAEFCRKSREAAPAG